MTDILSTLASVPFAVAVTSLLRRRWPTIDGAYVYLVVLALSVIAALLGYYRAAIPAEVWTAVSPLLVAVLSLGGVQTAQDVARKAIVVAPDPTPLAHKEP